MPGVGNHARAIAGARVNDHELTERVLSVTLSLPGQIVIAHVAPITHRLRRPHDRDSPDNFRLFFDEPADTTLTRVSLSGPAESFTEPLIRSVVHVRPDGSTSMAYALNKWFAVGRDHYVNDIRASLQGRWVEEWGVFGKSSDVDRFLRECKSDRCREPSLHCAARALLHALRTDDWSRVQRLHIDLVAGAIHAVLTGIAMGAPVPSKLSYRIAAFGPHLADAMRIVRRMPKGPYRDAAISWLRGAAKTRRDIEAKAYLRWKSLVIEHTLWPDAHFAADQNHWMSERYGNEMATLELRRAARSAVTLRKLPPTLWHPSDLALHQDKLRDHLMALVKRLRARPDLLWSPKLRDELQRLLQMRPRHAAVRRIIASFIHDLRALRAEVLDIVCAAHDPNRTEWILRISKELHRRGYSATEAEQVLNRCPANVCMSQLSAGLAG